MRRINSQSATAYQFRIFESAEIETVALDCQDTLHSVVKFYQTSQHAENLHATRFHITAFSVETYLHLRNIPGKQFLFTLKTIPPPCTAPN